MSADRRQMDLRMESAKHAAPPERAAPVYTEGLFATGHDAANRAVVRGCSYEELDLVGVAVRADRRVTDKILKGVELHR
jgi:hypothetical protein